MHLEIKPATSDDAEAISRLTVDCIRTTNSSDYPADVIDRTCENFTPERVLVKMLERHFFIAFSDDALVATVSYSGNTLHSLFVKPDAQGKGIGRELVRFVEELASAIGMREIELHASVTAREFYQRLNYVEIAFEERMDGSTYLMRKVLPVLR